MPAFCKGRRVLKLLASVFLKCKVMEAFHSLKGQSGQHRERTGTKAELTSFYITGRHLYLQSYHRTGRKEYSGKKKSLGTEKSRQMKSKATCDCHRHHSGVVRNALEPPTAGINSALTPLKLLQHSIVFPQDGIIRNVLETNVITQILDCQARI